MSKTMPNEIKVIVLLLIVSACSMFVGTYLDMDFYTESGGYDPYIYTMDIVWAFIVAWVIWDVAIKKKDHKNTFLILAGIVFIFGVWNTIEYGFLYTTVVAAFEVVAFLSAYQLLKSNSVVHWQNGIS